ncbi:hypothetical protein CASFOL_005710 [Castilleja foliolosa]|uniref:Uncharacterized protein n=1 Tax=Castilleja foliolosa TaxID=1961234 RepID=A0ABD3E5D2_9LAMI
MGSLEEKDLLVKIALTSQHVDEENPKLDISGTEAYLLTNCLENLDNPPRRFSKDLAMTDMLGNRYRMTVSNHHSEFPSRFLVNTDWSRFVHLHKLKEGDELGFYRLLDPDSGQTCCIVRPFKNPGNLELSSFSDDNQSMRILPSPENSVAPPDDMEPIPQTPLSVLTKTLTAQDTNPRDPVLYINASDAYTLTGRLEILNPTPIPSPMELVVFQGNWVYNMLLSYSSTNAYSISQDWGHLVTMHKLTAGDQIIFSRCPTSDGLGSSYKIEIVKREEPKIITQPLKPIDLNRGIPVPAYKLTKTLSVHQGNVIKLWFDVNEAWILTGCYRVLDDCPIGTLLMSLLAYDESDIPYDMALMHMKRDNGKVVCTLDAGWQRFVEHHGLKAGDKVTICNIKGKKYYTLEYTKAELPSGRGASGVGPGGSGQKGAEQS